MRAFLLVVFVALVEAQTASNDFQLQSALGFWYQLADIKQPYENTFAYCTTANYVWLNGSISITNSARDQPSPSAQTCVIYGRGTIADYAAPQAWTLNLVGNPCAPVYSVSSYLNWAWYAGYPSYQIAILTGGNDSLYVLSRTPSISQSQMRSIQQKIPNLSWTLQQGCW